MEISINYWAIFVCAILSMVVGSLWYGPLFGKKWMEIVGANPDDLEMRKKMQKEAMPLYAVQFVLSLLQLYILAHFIKAWTDGHGVETAIFLFLGFVMPTVAACSMWTAEPGKRKWARFLIQTGYFFILFLIYGYILWVWK